MENSKPNSKHKITIRDLYPELDNKGLQEAEENLERYVQHVLWTYERIRSDPEAYAKFKALTASEVDLGSRALGQDFK